MRQRLFWILHAVPPAAAFSVATLWLGPPVRTAGLTERLWLVGLQVLLWASLAVGLAALACARRVPARGAALLVGPLAATAAWTLARVDPTAELPSAVSLTLVGALLMASLGVLGVAARWIPTGLASSRGWLVGGALLAALFVAPELLPGSRSGTGSDGDPPSVLLISLDTCRIDCMGPYRPGCDLTPHIDRLAEDGVVFENVAAPMPLTGPSHVGILTGLAPVASGVTRNGVALDPSTPSVAQVFADHGYRTAAFVSGLPMSDRSVGLGAHFDHYDDRLDHRSPVDPGYWRRALPRLALRALRRLGLDLEPDRWERSGARTVDRALDWLRREHDGPFFVFCHLYDLHHPYEPPARWRAGEPGYGGPLQGNWNSIPLAERGALTQDPRAMRHMRRLYEGEMQEVDHQVGRLLDGLREHGLEDNTVVMLTADHGESLDEHGVYFDHDSLYDVEIRVPLILRRPDRAGAGTRVQGNASVLDLGATLLELTGLPPTLPGRSLLPALTTLQVEPALRFAAAAVSTRTGRESWSVTRGRHKLILVGEEWQNQEYRPPHELLFDLVEDPGEIDNLIHREPALRDTLHELLRPWWQRHRGLTPATVDPTLAHELSALGYGQ